MLSLLCCHFVPVFSLCDAVQSDMKLAAELQAELNNADAVSSTSDGPTDAKVPRAVWEHAIHMRVCDAE